MSDSLKMTIIWNWLEEPTRYKNGVTNKEVIDCFGKEYKEVWESLKRKKKSMFYENGKWFRWT